MASKLYDKTRETFLKGDIAALQVLQTVLPNIAQLGQNAVNSLFGQDKGYLS